MAPVFSDDFVASIKEVGGVFKFGSGVLGKSAIALGVLLVAIIVAVARLHSDGAILGAIAMGLILFAGWFALVLKFAGDHPDVALLEGAEWSSYHRFQAAAKGFIPELPEKEPTSLPGVQAALPGDKTLHLEGDNEGRCP